VLTASGLAYRLPTGRVLFEGVTLSVELGQVIFIEGPSGTGKSTLLALLGGVLRSSVGDVTTTTVHPAPFAWVLQTLNSLNARTVLANAMLFARLDGTSTKVASGLSREMLRLVGIDALASARAGQLSGGELQRLAVVRALSCTRPVILADEPTNQLDRVNARLVMSTLVEQARDQNRSAVVVTHDRDSVPSDARILRLDESGLHAA